MQSPSLRASVPSSTAPFFLKGAHQVAEAVEIY